MVNWSDIVSSGTTAGYVTINNNVYGYRTDISVSESRGINIVGNPLAFFSVNGFEANINDGRTRNALRTFVYNALRGESDYTDAQAAAWADQILFVKSSNNTVNIAAGRDSFTPWAVPSGVGGSQVNLTLSRRPGVPLANVASGANTQQLYIVAVRDRNGHTRAWRILAGTRRSPGVFGNYVKLTDAQIRTEFGVATQTPDAVAGTFSVGAKTATAQGAEAPTFDIEAASGGTGTITYSLVSPPAGITISGRTVTVASSVATNNAISLTARATWTSGTSTATADSTFTLKFTRTPNANTGTFTVGSKTVSVQGDVATTFDIEAASGGVGAITYAIVSPPSGITLSGRTITIASTVASNNAIPLTVRAIWTSGTSAVALTRTFNLAFTRTPNAVAGSFTPGNQTVTIPSSNTGSATVDFNAATGGTGTITYALAVNGGSSVTVSGNTITVPSTQNAGAFRVAVTATWTSGTTTAVNTQFFNLTIVRTVAPSAGSFTVGAKTLNLTSSGTGSTTIEAASGGTGTISYSLLSPPSGITISGRTVSVSKDVTAGAKSLTARATWTTVEGTATLDATFTLTVNRTLAPKAGSLTQGDIAPSIPVGTQNNSLPLSTATGGVGTVTYSLVSPPTGITLTRNNWITIGDTAIVGVYNITYRATWTTVEGSVNLDVTFKMTLTRPFYYVSPAVTVRKGTPTVMVAARGATPPYTYSLGTVVPRSTAFAEGVSQGVSTGVTHGNNGNQTPLSLTVHPLNNLLFASLHAPSDRGYRLATVNASTGVISVRGDITGTTGNTGDDPLAIDFAPDGTLYGLRTQSNGAAKLYTINTTTRVATFVADVSISGNTRYLDRFAVLSNAEAVVGTTRGNSLYTLNLSTGVTTVRPGTVQTSNVGITATVYRGEVYTWITGEGLYQGTTKIANETARGESGVTAFGDDLYALAWTGGNAIELYKFTGTVTPESFSTTLPTGITFNSTTRAVSAAASAAITTHRNLRMRVTDSSSPANTISSNITLTVSGALPPAVAGTFSVGNKVLNLSSSTSGTFDLEEATGGTGTVAYTLVTPPTGITLSGRTVTVANTVAANDNISITARATWTSGDSTATTDSTFSLDLNRTQAPKAGSFSVGAKTLNLTSTSSGTVDIDAATGGTGTVTYELLSPPTGITISGRTISVTGSVTAGAKSLSARATWTTPEGTEFLDSSFTLTVNRTRAPSAGTFEISDKSLNFGLTDTTLTATIEAATGGVGTISYSLVSPPSGVTLSGRTLSVARTVTSQDITVRATWTTPEGTATVDADFTLTITVDVAAEAGTFQVNNKAVAAAINTEATFTIEAATGGVGTISYSLVSPPGGFSITDRTITANRAVQAGVGISITARATWTTTLGTATVDSTFTLTLVRTGFTQNALLCDIPDMTIPVGSDAAEFVLPPISSPGTLTWTYLVSNLPNGVSFDASTRTLTVGTTATTGTHNLVYRAQSGANAQAQSFSVTLVAYTQPDTPEPPTTPDVVIRVTPVAFHAPVEVGEPIGITTTPGDHNEPAAVAINPVDRVLYIITRRVLTVGQREIERFTLGTLNKSTAEYTRIGDVTGIELGGNHHIEIDFDSKGVLHALEVDYDNPTSDTAVGLFTINTTTGAATKTADVTITGATTADDLPHAFAINRTNDEGLFVVRGDHHIEGVNLTTGATIAHPEDEFVPDEIFEDDDFEHGFTVYQGDEYFIRDDGTISALHISDRTHRVVQRNNLNNVMGLAADHGDLYFIRRRNNRQLELWEVIPTTVRQVIEQTGIPAGSLIKCLPAPVEYPRARGTTYKVFVNGKLVGLGDDE